MIDDVDVREEQEKARQIDNLHKNLSVFVDGAHLPILMGALTMLITEIILDISDNEEKSQRLADNFTSALKLAIELTYLNVQKTEYMQ